MAPEKPRPLSFNGIVFKLTAAFLLGTVLFEWLVDVIGSVAIPLFQGILEGKPSSVLGTLNTRRFLLSTDFHGHFVQFSPLVADIGAIIVGLAAVVLFVAWLRGGEKSAINEPSVVGRRCPECLSLIPAAARRCSYCRSQVEPQIAPQDTT